MDMMPKQIPAMNFTDVTFTLTRFARYHNHSMTNKKKNAIAKQLKEKHTLNNTVNYIGYGNANSFYLNALINPYKTKYTPLDRAFIKPIKESYQKSKY